jgi:hypothetical protein
MLCIHLSPMQVPHRLSSLRAQLGSPSGSGKEKMNLVTAKPQALRAVFTILRKDSGASATRFCLPPPDQRADGQADGRGEPSAALRNHGYLDAHHGQPRPSSPQPDYTLVGTNPITAMQGQTTDAAPAIKLDNNVLR